MKKLKSDLDSTERFGFEWDKYRSIIPEYEEQFLKWVFPLKKEDFRNKKVLDGGCGIGRNSFWPLRYNAKEVFAFDYDERTVKVAQDNLSKYKNSVVYYGSIYKIDYINKFDISFSIGVIHHLSDPRLAIAQLVQATKKGGKVLIWVYGYEGNEWIVKYISPIRKYTSRIPLKIVNYLAYCFSAPLYIYLKLSKTKSLYLAQIARFRFWHVHSIVFDQLIPKIANYWKKKEALLLFENQGLKDIKAYQVNGNSWTIIGTKK